MTADDLRDHTTEVGGLTGSLVSIDTDAQGELYLVFLSGSILRVTTTADADRDGIDDALGQPVRLERSGAAVRGPFGDPTATASSMRASFGEARTRAVARWPTSARVPKDSSPTRIGLLNDRDTDEPVALRFLRAGGQAMSAPRS